MRFLSQPSLRETVSAKKLPAGFLTRDLGPRIIEIGPFTIQNRNPKSKITSQWRDRASISLGLP